MATGLDTVLNKIEEIKGNVARSFNQVAAQGGTVPVGAGIASLPSAIATLAKSPTGAMPGVCKVTFTVNPSSAGSAYVPTTAVEEALLNGAKVKVFIEGGKWEYTIPSLQRNTTWDVLMPVTGSKNAVYSVAFGASSENVLVAPGSIALVEGGSKTCELVSYLYTEACTEVGRLQRLDQNVADSYPIVRRGTEGNVVECFGHFYKDASNVTSWVNETGVANYIPTMSADGTITSTAPSPRTDYETTCFPWNEMRRVTFDVNGGSETLYMTECPLYYVKSEVRTVAFRTVTASGAETTVNVACRIWWVCKTQLAGYEYPSWAYRYALDPTDVAGTYRKTKSLKAAHYMPCYKTTSATIATKTCATSKPYAGVAGGQTREWINNAAHELNGFSLTVSGSGVFADGTAFAADATRRRFAGGTWHEHHAFRFLQYLQFGVDPQSVLLGLTVNHGAANSYQDYAEACFSTNPGVPTFAIGTATESNPIVWMWILNPWGNEGEQMVDATVFAERLEDDTTKTTCLCMLDRAKFDPHGTVKATLLASGYEELSYALPTGDGMGLRRGFSTDPDYLAFEMPTASTDNALASLIAVQDNYWISGFPSSGSPGAVARMASLSGYGVAGRSLGPWFLYALGGPSASDGADWGARLSLSLLASEAEGGAGAS